MLQPLDAGGSLIDVCIANANGALSLPHGLAFGPDGHLYVASAGNDRVLRYNGTTGAFADTIVPAGTGSSHDAAAHGGPPAFPAHPAVTPHLSAPRDSAASRRAR